MKKHIITVICFLFAFVTNAYQQEPTKMEDVIFLFETDVHGNLPNYAYLAYLADSLDASDKTVYILSGGDFSSGNCVTGITKGEAAIRVINKIPQYVAIVPGNHEWDYGFETLKRNDSLLIPEMICCNVFYRDSLLFKPYKIKNVGDKRIAFIGILTYETTSTACPADFKASKEYRILDGDELAIQVQKCVDEVRSDSLADYVFLLAHLGDEDNLLAKKGISKKTTHLLKHISGVDAVLNGHDHKEKNKMLYDKFNKKIPELSTGQSLAKIGIIRILSDGTLSTELLPIDKVKGVSSTVKATIDSIQNCYAYIKKPIGTVDFTLLAENIRVKETNLGDYVADAILWAAKQTDSRVSMTIVNSGSIRKDICKGKVNFEQEYNAVPFTNYICIVKLKGTMIESILNQMVKTWPEKSGGFPQVTGITFSIDTLDKKRVKDIMVRLPDDTWAPLDNNMEYYVATTDFIASGGDSVDMNIDINTDVIPLYTKLYMIDVVSMYYRIFGVMKDYENPDNRIKIAKTKAFIDSK